MLQLLKEDYRSGFGFKKTCLAVSLALSASSVAFAQESTTEKAEEEDLEVIAITGTLIRGIEATGSQAIELGSKDIQVSGVTTSNELLGTIPQASNLFNDNSSVGSYGTVAVANITRPNLRSMPGFFTSTGAATLVLVDSHRVTGMGVKVSAVDPDIIPTAIVERVDVITDGGSSLYGADAIGGVINFITKRDFEGVQIDAGVTSGDNFWTYNTAVTAGKVWDDTSAYIALTHSDRDGLINNDRDWAKSGIWTADGLVPSGTRCINPVSSQDTYEYTDFGGFLPAPLWYNSASVKTGDACDIDGEGTLYPEEMRNAMFVGLTHVFSDSVELSVKGFYSDRKTTLSAYPIGDSLVLGRVPSGPANLGDTQDVVNVGFSYGAHSDYVNRDIETTLELFGITPEITVDLNSDWQLRGMMHYSQSDNYITEPTSNRLKLIDYYNDGQFDPFDVASTESSVLQDILNQEVAGQSIQDLFISRVIVDGPVMSVPAGDLRIAAGVEYIHRGAKMRSGNVESGMLKEQLFPSVSRDIEAVFAEINLPLVKDTSWANNITLSASARYDHYEDLGGTTNPQVGINYEVNDWLTMYASWGKSFNAPTLLDKLNAINSQINYAANNTGLVQPVADALGIDVTGKPDVISVGGANDDLDPQKAEIFAAGTKIVPTFVEGLSFSAHYYDITYNNILGSFSPIHLQSALAFTEKFLWNPTQEDIDEFAKLGFNGEELLAGVSPDNVSVLIDLRTTNASQAIIQGLDFSANYQFDNSLGYWDISLSGNQQTKYVLATKGNDFESQIDYGTPRTRLSGGISLEGDQFSTKLTLKHTVGFDIADAALVDGEPIQTKVDSFTVADFYLGYEFMGDGFTDGLSIRLNINNVFDSEPPLYKKNEQISYFGYTLGRTFGVSMSKYFF
ncbi:TonB-dependent receptor (plasmid) [Alteromonas sp. I4]|nr:TonB-dependent receptor [Alteromonas sp. I4]